MARSRTSASSGPYQAVPRTLPSTTRSRVDPGVPEPSPGSRAGSQREHLQHEEALQELEEMGLNVAWSSASSGSCPAVPRTLLSTARSRVDPSVSELSWQQSWVAARAVAARGSAPGTRGAGVEHCLVVCVQWFSPGSSSNAAFYSTFQGGPRRSRAQSWQHSTRAVAAR